jgi:hypothetical protein
VPAACAAAPAVEKQQQQQQQQQQQGEAHDSAATALVSSQPCTPGCPGVTAGGEVPPGLRKRQEAEGAPTLVSRVTD